MLIIDKNSECMLTILLKLRKCVLILSTLLVVQYFKLSKSYSLGPQLNWYKLETAPTFRDWYAKAALLVIVIVFCCIAF